MTQSLQSDIQTLYRYIYGNWHTMIITVYTELAIADHLKTTPRTITDLAYLTNTNASALKRIMKCGEIMGLHTVNHDQQIHLSTLGKHLCSDSPHSLRAAARLNGAPYRYAPWGNLLEYVKTGTGEGLSPTWKDGTLPYLQNQPELLAVFEEAMDNLGRTTLSTEDENHTISRSFNFSSYNSFIDIGGGNGILAQEILNMHPRINGCVFDLPEVIQAHQGRINQQKGGMINFIAGDFYDYIPSGYDLYITKNIIHNHPDDRCTQVLDRIHEAMTKEKNTPQRLLLCELIQSEVKSDNPITSFTDLNLHLLTGGSERTEQQYRELLATSGFDVAKIHTLEKQERKLIEAEIA